MEGRVPVLAEIINRCLPAIGGLVVGFVAGVAVMWWVFL